MTTIATDGKTIAADGRRMWGSDIVGENEMKLRVVGGRIYALTGLAPLFDALVEWHMKGADPKTAPDVKDDCGWSLIVIDRKGIGKLSSTCPYIEYFPPPIAFGAGLDLALGAMLAGKSPKEAIDIVARRTNHTGGTIQVIDIAEALELPVKRLEAAE